MPSAASSLAFHAQETNDDSLVVDDSGTEEHALAYDFHALAYVHAGIAEPPVAFTNHALNVRVLDVAPYAALH